MKKHISIIFNLLITGSLLIFIRCSDSDSGSGSAPGTLNANIAGIWQLTGGEHIDNILVDELKYIRFNEDGTAAFFYESIFHVLSNEHVLYAVLNNNTVLIGMKKGCLNSAGSYFRNNYNTEEITKQMGGPGALYTYNRPDSSTLTLTDSSQNIISFTSASQVPEELVMKEFTVQEEYRDIEIEPGDLTNFVWDGTYLWYEEANYTDMIYPFDPVSGQLIANSAVELSSAGQYTHIQAFQSGYFWTHCACGNNENASLRDPVTNGGEIDLVDTDTGGLNNKISIDGIAWDNDNSYLWLAGYNHDLAEYQFLKVNSNAEPDTLEAIYEFDRAGNMTWDGTYFWMVLWDSIIKINPDPAGFTAADTYYTPDVNIELKGIAAVGPDIYLLGIDDSKVNKGVIFKVTP